MGAPADGLLLRKIAETTTASAPIASARRAAPAECAAAVTLAQQARALVLVLKNYASAYIDRWNMLLGVVFVFIVLAMPTGIVPGLSKLLRRRPR